MSRLTTVGSRPTNLFEGIQSYTRHPSSATTWDSNGAVAQRPYRHLLHAPSKCNEMTAGGQAFFVPIEGAAPLTSIAPLSGSVPLELDSSDDEREVAMEVPGVEADDASKAQSKVVQALRECHCPFEESTTWNRIYDSNGVTVPAMIFAKFRSKCLDKSNASESHYITYRRNYFANEMWFELKPPTRFADGKLYVDYEDATYPVKSFGVRMRAVNTDEQGEDVEISVFTAKRDHPIEPTPVLQQKMQPNMTGYRHVYDESTGFGHSKFPLPVFHSFFHMQFRQATKNNGSRRKQQSYYRIIVELRVLILGPFGDEVWIKIASTISGSLVVRGRCPGSFADDPNYRKSKPRKRSHRRPYHKAARLAQRKGHPKTTSHKTPKKVGIQRIPFHTVNTAVPSTRVSLTSDSRSRTSTDTTPSSTEMSPVMSPKNEVHQSLRLPNRNRNSVFFEAPESAGSLMVRVQLNEDFEHKGLASNCEMFNPMVDVHRLNTLSQIERLDSGYRQQSYVDLRRSFVQGLSDASTPRELIHGHFGYSG